MNLKQQNLAKIEHYIQKISVELYDIYFKKRI